CSRRFYMSICRSLGRVLGIYDMEGWDSRSLNCMFGYTGADSCRVDKCKSEQHQVGLLNTAPRLHIMGGFRATRKKHGHDNATMERPHAAMKNHALAIPHGRHG